MVLHAFLRVWRIRDHVGGDLTAPIENNLHGAITVLPLLITAASLEPALPSWQRSRCGAVCSVPCAGRDQSSLSRHSPACVTAGPRTGGTEGRRARGTAGWSPSAWHARPGRSLRAAPAPPPARRPSRCRIGGERCQSRRGAGARGGPLALRGRAAPASARADPALAAPFSAAAPLPVALSCLPPRAAGASSMREKRRRRRRWELLAGHPRRPASRIRPAAAPLLPHLPAARSRP